MPELNETPVLRLPLTRQLPGGGRRETVGYTTVRDDPFTRSVLATITWNTNGSYATANVKYDDGHWHTVLMHRLIYEHYHGPIPPRLEIDHIDRDKLNNLPDNLRAVTRSVNRANCGPPSNNKSGIKNVSWDQTRKLWLAMITKDGKPHRLGAFQDRDAATQAVAAARAKYYPELTRGPAPPGTFFHESES